MWRRSSATPPEGRWEGEIWDRRKGGEVYPKRLSMYQAKERGRGNYQFFSAELHARTLDRLSLEEELERALEETQFVLHYQPKFRLDELSPCGAEALVRWNHPERGLVPPTEFIPLAEERGKIRRLGAWILEEACRCAAGWSTLGSRRLQVAVNLSARQFQGDELVVTVQGALQRRCPASGRRKKGAMPSTPPRPAPSAATENRDSA